MPPVRALRLSPIAGTLAVLAVLVGCEGAARFDERTESRPVQAAQEQRAAPDARGVISYPGYRVAVARTGDSVRDVAARVGVDAARLADFNGLFPDYRLREGEVLALPGDGGAPGGRDIESIAAQAIDSAGTGAAPGAGSGAVSTAPLPPPGTGAGSPLRHRVGPGETAFSIAAQYGVSPRTLAEWNGLGPDFAVREGQFLLIPTGAGTRTAETADAGQPSGEERAAADVAPVVSPPGRRSETPTPPSAADPLPEEPRDVAPPPSPRLDQFQSAGRNDARFLRPVEGEVLRGYGTDGNEGIDIAVPPGTTVRAAGDGEVALISRSVGDSLIVLVRHEDNLYTVYSNVSGSEVEKGQRVTRGQPIGRVIEGSPSFLHFEVRRGTESTDPSAFLE